MKIEVESPELKVVKFSAYEKYFMEALRNPDLFHLLFYRKSQEGIQISFSWDNFIVITNISYDEILKIYEGQNLATADVILSKSTEDHPILLKFYNDYLFNRGIPEEAE